MDDYGHGNLGFILLAILYLFMAIGSLISPALVKVIGVRKCIGIGGFGTTLFGIAQILPAWKNEYFDEYDKWSYS